jgi:DNA modification methylase
MKPYYERGGIVICHGDCREFLKGPLNHRSLFVTDPPYGIDLHNHGRNDGRRRRQSFEIAGDADPYLGQMAIDALQSRPLIAFASPLKPWLGDWDQYLVWNKGPAVGGGGHPVNYWKFTWELIQCARLGPLAGQRDCAVLNYPVVPADSRDHPAEKPLELVQYLLWKASISGPLIVDPFMGTGPVLVAAKNLGLEAIGIEIEERYCEIAAKRLSQEVLNLR